MKTSDNPGTVKIFYWRYQIMGIAWKYLDKKSAAADAVKDYGSMKFII